MLARAQLDYDSVKNANICLDEADDLRLHKGMLKSRVRPAPQPPRDELIRLRQQKYPTLLQRDFAKLLGITRLHLIAVEQGYRRPSLDLVLRWLELLKPEARLSMFGEIPGVTARLKQLQKLPPETFKAA
jgi:DNA-binding XRE family transcriptional regulator